MKGRSSADGRASPAASSTRTLVGTLTGKEKIFETAVFDDRVRQLVREVKVPSAFMWTSS
jgi:hypothetical protein